MCVRSVTVLCNVSYRLLTMVMGGLLVGAKPTWAFRNVKGQFTKPRKPERVCPKFRQCTSLFANKSPFREYEGLCE